MRKVITALFLFTILFSCEKYPEPGSETLEQFRVHKQGNFQSASSGSYLQNKVGAQIDINSLVPANRNTVFRLEITVTLGGGMVDEESIIADDNGLMTTQWKLGNERNQQEISCKILDNENRLHAEFTIEATAFFENKLNEIKTGYLVGIADMVYDTVGQRTMMYNKGDIWVLEDKFYAWEQKIYPFGEHIRYLEMTSDGTVFAAGWRGSLFKTDNWGESWEYLCHPIPNNEYYYNFNITSDDYLWATKNNYGIYYSKDKGLTWETDSTARISNSMLGRIYKYQESYMCVAGSPLSIVQKNNTTPGWHDINTPEYSLSMYIPNDSTIIAQNQGGFRLHKSTDNGQTYKKVFTPYTSMGGGDLWHVYNHFGKNYFVLAPSNGLWATRDFENFEQLISIKTHQSKVFIDHNGTIYAVGSRISNAEDEATYVLPNYQ